MTCVPAPACKVALAEATQLHPQRSKASDGVCASPDHHNQNPNSDHETGDAWDLTHDPVNGCDVDALFALLVHRRDPRIKYLIRNRQMLRSYDKPGIPAWTWSTYTGSNPHKKHGHCSILPGTRDIVVAWFTPYPDDPDPQPVPEDDVKEIHIPVDDAGNTHDANGDPYGPQLAVLGNRYTTLESQEEHDLLVAAGYVVRKTKPFENLLNHNQLLEYHPR